MKKSWFKENKLEIAFVASLFLYAAVALLLYVIFSHIIAKAIYKGKQLWPYSHGIPLAHYYRIGEKLFFKAIFYYFIGICCTVFIFVFFNKAIKNKPVGKRYIFLLGILMVVIQCIFFIRAFNHTAPKRIPSKEEQITRAFGKDFYKQVLFIRQNTPKDSVLIFKLQNSVSGQKWEKLAFYNYFLFPRIINYENTREIGLYEGPVYKITINRPSPDKPLDSEDSSVLISKERRARKNLPLLDDFTQIKANFINLALAFLKLFLIFASGSYIVHRYFAERSLISFIATSFLVGITVISVFYIILSLFKIKFTELSQFLFLGAMSVPALPLLSKGKVKFSFFPNLPVNAKVTFMIIAALFTLIFLMSMLLCTVDFDGCVIWTQKAKSIFALHGLSGLNLYSFYAKSYPPLLPILMSQTAIAGERMAKLTVALFALFLYAIIYDEILATSYPAALKIFLPFLIFGSSVFFWESVSIVPDLVFTVFITKALSILLKLLKYSAQNLMPALAIILSGIVLLRPDGAVYFFIITGLVCSVFFFKKYRNLNCLFFLLIPIFSAAAWHFYFNSVLHIKSDLSYLWSLRGAIRGFNWSHLYIIIVYFLEYMLDPRNHGIISLVFVLLLFFRLRNLARNYPLEIIFISAAMLWLFIYTCYIVSIFGNIYFRTGFIRYLMPIVAAMFLIILKESDRMFRGKAAA